MSLPRLPFALLSLTLVLAGGTLAACGEDALAVNASARPAAVSARSAQVSEAKTVPATFLGEWNMRREDCGGHLNDSRLVISAQGLELHESSGEVVSTAVAGDTLTVKARMSGEGETWDETYRFRISEDGRVLLQLLSPDNQSVKRLRCFQTTPH